MPPNSGAFTTPGMCYDLLHSSWMRIPAWFFYHLGNSMSNPISSLKILFLFKLEESSICTLKQGLMKTDEKATIWKSQLNIKTLYVCPQTIRHKTKFNLTVCFTYMFITSKSNNHQYIMHYEIISS